MQKYAKNFRNRCLWCGEVFAIGEVHPDNGLELWTYPAPCRNNGRPTLQEGYYPDDIWCEVIYDVAAV